MYKRSDTGFMNCCFVTVLLTVILFSSCSQPATMFTIIPAKETGIDFVNHNEDTDTLNILDYLYFYNGAGLAAADFNKDGLTDIYFVANQGGNKLYLNKGNFQFEDKTREAGVGGSADWSTGVTVADVNADGWPDIYVCTVANHTPTGTGHDGSKTYFLNSKNQLFINEGLKNGQIHFREAAAEFGLDIAGYSTQSAFFDYDKDGDLDMFLLQHSVHQTDTYGDTALRRKYSAVSGCKLYRNDQGHFSNATQGSGIYSSALGYGLGLAIADFNQDGWDDVYIGNDFHENDYYLINQGNGTFSEQNTRAFGYESNFSMGNDAVDINNDGYTDLITLDMLPGDERILKSSLNDESYDEYENLHGTLGYHQQYSRNCLQLNTAKGSRFAEMGLWSGIAATDWSWGVLGADFNLDGRKDFFISNGIKRRLNDLDYIRFISDGQVKTKVNDHQGYDKELLHRMPDAAWHNYLFLGGEQLRFEDASLRAGFDAPTLSNGCVYADLDNDGDLDLVVNNINAPAGLYRNNQIVPDSKNHPSWLQIQLEGRGGNTFGIGTKLFVWTKGLLQYQQLQTTRGFMSAVPARLYFGFGSLQQADSIAVLWPDGSLQQLKNIPFNQQLKIRQSNATPAPTGWLTKILQSDFSIPAVDIAAASGINWRHAENTSFSDFGRNSFIPHQLSSLGPAAAVADINADGLDDIFIGGAKNQPAKIWIQQSGGKFMSIPQPAIEADSVCEDIRAVFFDADQDGDADLYVASGGGEYYGTSPQLLDRLYVNDSKGHFQRGQPLPPNYENKGALAVADFDGDGDMDVFSGSRANSMDYGLMPHSFLWRNEGNSRFTDITRQVAGLDTAGMISDAVWADLNGDHYPELILVGEFMPPVIFENQQGTLTRKSIPLLNQKTGWWQSVKVADVNADGKPDLLLGNYGLNSKLNASEAFPIRLYRKDFDNNHFTDQILCIAKEGKYYPFLGKETMERQLPYLKKEFLSFQKMAGKTVEEIFGNKLDDASMLEARTLASAVALNQGQFTFTWNELPDLVQWMPVFDFASWTPGNWIAGGNFYGVLPFEGRYDNALMPVWSFGSKPQPYKAVQLQGEVRRILPVRRGNLQQAWLVVRNHAAPALLLTQPE